MLGSSWRVSKVRSILNGLIRHCKNSYLVYNPSTWRVPRTSIVRDDVVLESAYQEMKRARYQERPDDSARLSRSTFVRNNTREPPSVRRARRAAASQAAAAAAPADVPSPQTPPEPRRQPTPPRPPARPWGAPRGGSRAPAQAESYSYYKSVQIIVP